MTNTDAIGTLQWRCPVHHRPLAVAADLVCPVGCHFPVTDSVVRFMADDSYSASFGLQWNQWPQTQLDSHSGTTVSRVRLMATLGPAAATLSGARVLEVGCGAGRFTEVLLAEGAAVCSVDLSRAVDANARNYPTSANHVVAQADARNLPLIDGQFDIVLGLGMVQHTPSPEATIAHLTRQVRPGGWLVIDHYASSWVHRVRLAQVYRALMKRMDPVEALERTIRMHDFWSPIHRRTTATVPRKALLVVSPIVYFGEDWEVLDDQQKREWGILDTYDSLTDTYKHRRSPEQIRRVLESLPLEDLWVGMLGAVVVARGRRRQGPEES